MLIPWRVSILNLQVENPTRLFPVNFNRGVEEGVLTVKDKHHGCSFTKGGGTSGLVSVDF